MTDRPDPEPPGSLGDDLRAAVVEARVAAASELAYQSARAALAGKAAGRIAGLVLLALALFWFALMALVFGVEIALLPLLGPWGAMGAVVCGLLVLTGVTLGLARLAWLRLRALFAAPKDAA